jgi:hypothetical protein
MAYMKDSGGRRLDSFVPLGLADDAVLVGAMAFRQMPKIQSSTGGKITAKPLGEGSAGIWDIVHDDTVGYLIHGQTGPNTTGSVAVFAAGLDNGGGHGYLGSGKSAGRLLEMVNNPSSTGDLGRFRNWSHTALASDFMLHVGAKPVRIRQADAEGFGDGSATIGQTTFTSATAGFTVADEGRTISQLTSRGEGFVFAANTVIQSVTNSTTVVLDKAAIKTGSGVNFQIVGRPSVSTQTVLEFLNAGGTQKLDLTPERLKVLNGAKIQVEDSTSNGRLTSLESGRVAIYATNGTNFKRSELYGVNYFWTSLRAYSSAGSIGGESTSVDVFKFSTAGVGFNGTDPVAKGTITGSRGGNAALAALLTYLASRGDITDSSTA